MKPSTTARRYADAAFDVAQQNREVETWLRDLRRVSETVTDRSAALYFRDPNVPVHERLDALDRLFPGLNPHVRNLLRMLAARDRVQLVPAIYGEFQHLDRTARGILEAEVTVARPFDQQERDEIIRRLSSATGKQVEVQMQVDPAILGGIVVQIGDRLIDASVAGRLARLRHALAV